jgi:anti-sigma regulatory factor (Ser/Thr protein kinase)
MTNNPADIANPTRPICPAHHFELRFTATPRGARLARRLCAERLDAWGITYGTEPHDAICLIVAELSSNAVRHGGVPGRDFHVRLTAEAGPAATVRIEVTDTRADREPEPAPDLPGPERAGGRGLLLVGALADRWGWTPRPNGDPGKTVWAEYGIPNPGTQPISGQM